MMPISLWLLLIANVLVGVLGQVLLKNVVTVHKGNQIEDLFSLISDWKLILAICCYVLNLALYLILLSRQNLGYIFAMQVSFGIIAVNIASVFFFNENMSAMSMTGIVVIIIGIFLLNIK